VFLELKTGGAIQNKNEKNIEKVVRAGKVRYEVMRLDKSI
jgi:predicted Holliday junction resolvase-like endonuclease